MDSADIEYKPLSADEKAFILTVLAKTNGLLKLWHQNAKFSDMKFRAFRNLALNKTNTLAEKLSESEAKQFVSDMQAVLTIRKNHPELGDRSVEFSIIQGYVTLAKLHAAQWSVQSSNNGVTFDDLLQEAFMQILESMYHWNPEAGADITTYIWWSLRNRMSNVVNQQGSFLSRLSNVSIKLLDQFNKARNAMGGMVSNEQVIAQMELCAEETTHLRDILTRTQCASSFETDDSGGENQDYTALRMNIDSQNESNNILEKMSVREILDKSNLTPLERDLIETAMEPYYGWQKDVGSRHVSPKTQQPYGRMRVSQICDGARKKVAKVLEQVKD